MKISELFERLSFGELSNLSISNSGDGTIIANKHPQIIQYANDGLLDLFTRFIMREKDLILEQVEHITNYHFKRQFAESSGSSEPYPYIKDLPAEPFEEDLIRVLAVYNEFGQKLPLNDEGNDCSYFTPQWDVLQVPAPNSCRPLGVHYQARHEKLASSGEGYLDQDINLPFFLEPALINYIGYKVYSHMNGQENAVKSAEYFQTYDNICSVAENKDLVNQTFTTTNTKLEQRGFV